MRYDRIYNRYLGAKETFVEDGTRAGDIAGANISAMTATVISGNSVTIPLQSFDSVAESLAFQVSFDKIGSSVVKVTSTFSSGSDEAVTIYMFRTLDDGSNVELSDYT